MSRLAVQSGAHEFGPSRIPRRFGQLEPSRDDGVGSMQDGNYNGKPSRLQRLQSDYQRHLLKEKEDKLIEMYEHNQQRALEKVGRNKGVVRDFFNERRNNGSGFSPKNNLSPTIEHMYKRKQIEAKQTVPQRQTFGYNGHHYTSASGNQTNAGQYKSSAGRDRSKPLAPIQRAGQPNNPFPSKPQIVRPKTFKEMSRDKENLVDKEPMPRSAPTGNYGMDNDSGSDDSPLPTAKQLEALQQKRKLLQSQRSNKSMTSGQPSTGQANTGRKTDFQSWQEEQDRNRENRLKNHREKNGVVRPQPVEDEGFGEEDDDVSSKEEMKRKQAELIAQIEAQQRELERIRSERAREEMEEKKELERRKRIEEERKRKQIEEEKRKRKFEEEERIRREHEEEKARKLQQEKQRLRHGSERTKYEYEESDAEEEYGYTRKEPSPPPQPKPANSVGRRHPVPAKTKVAPRAAPEPPVGGVHTALYEAADQLEGAIGDTGRLRACYNCGRKFAEDRIQKHESACKNATKKRKVMDPSKLRTRGTEMEQYVGHKQPEPKAKKNNWRTQHENFIQAIKYARKVKQIEEGGGNLADLPPPPPSENPDYVQCPYCSRKFNEQAAERHIPHCKNTKSRPAPPRRR